MRHRRRLGNVVDWSEDNSAVVLGEGERSREGDGFWVGVAALVYRSEETVGVGPGPGDSWARHGPSTLGSRSSNGGWIDGLVLAADLGEEKGSMGTDG